MNWPVYPEYKDSEASDLDEIPTEWTAVRLRRLLTLNPAVPRKIRDDQTRIVPFIPMEAIGEDWSLNLAQSRAVEEVLTGYAYFEDGDVLFAKVTPCFENGKGALIERLPTGLGFGTTEVTVARPQRGLDPRFLGFLLRSDRFRQSSVAAMTGAGGLKRVPDGHVRDFRIGCPPLDQQVAIADFLDRETAKIDALIDKQNQMIATLREDRTATITRSVTKGLDPNVEMRDSGVGWIGETVSTWKVAPVRSAMRESNTRNEGAANLNYLSLMANIGVIPYAEKGDVGNKKPDDLSKCKVVKKNDFVINSMNYQIGSYGVSSHTGVCSPVYIVLRHDPAVVALRFALRIFETRGFQKYAQSFGNGILEHRRAISWDTLKNLRIPLPTLDEQVAIIKFLDAACAGIDALIGKATEVIATLLEYRSALISAAVTGKIDVRGAA